MNYREFYKEYYGIDFDKEFEVHHIDIDRSNNDISNLVLLPKKLHKRFHFYYNMLKNQKIPKLIFETGSPKDYIDINIYKKFLKVYEECQKWYDYKLLCESRRKNK